VSLTPYELLVVRSRDNPLCLAHGERYEKREASGMSHRNTLVELLQSVDCTTLELDWEVVTGLRCEHCGGREVVFPLWHLTADRQRCPQCGGPCFAERTSRIELKDPLALLPIETLGVPAKAYVRTWGSQGEFLIKLA
jgi:DNA-directed RNA polymerase subunit RPC12/RpoP